MIPDMPAILRDMINYEITPAQLTAARYLHLDRMRAALSLAGDPHLRLRVAHIAGTKGKGSTAAMVANIVRAAGLRAGLYTSPHLVHFRERMRINGEPISERELDIVLEELRPVIEAMRENPLGLLTFFEAITLLAFHWFARENVDVAVLETGMGGRLDATNVAAPLVTAITTIALDHTAELGDTLAAIAGEKAGIIKPGMPVVSAPQEAEAAAVIAERAQEVGSPLYRVGEELHVIPGAYSDRGQTFRIEGRLGEYELACPLLGEHQMVNAATAAGMAECLREAGLPITDQSIREGIATVRWPGRLQLVGENPRVMLDGAHDSASISALITALQRHFPGVPCIFVVGFAKDKDWPEMLRILSGYARDIVLTAASSPRATPVEELAECAQNLGISAHAAANIGEALRAAHLLVAPPDLICVTGSLYLVGEAIAYGSGVLS